MKIEVDEKFSSLFRGLRVDNVTCIIWSLMRVCCSGQQADEDETANGNTQEQHAAAELRQQREHPRQQHVSPRLTLKLSRRITIHTQERLSAQRQ